VAQTGASNSSNTSAACLLAECMADPSSCDCLRVHVFKVIVSLVREPAICLPVTREHGALLSSRASHHAKLPVS
jgi:hypothetical protein